MSKYLRYTGPNDHFQLKDGTLLDRDGRPQEVSADEARALLELPDQTFDEVSKRDFEDEPDPTYVAPEVIAANEKQAAKTAAYTGAATFEEQQAAIGRTVAEPPAQPAEHDFQGEDGSANTGDSAGGTSEDAEAAPKGDPEAVPPENNLQATENE